MSYLRKAFKSGNMNIILDGLQDYDNRMAFMYPHDDLPLIISVTERRLNGLKKMASKKQAAFADYLTETLTPDETIIRMPNPRKKGEK